jgi:ribonuclease BN (tRNA processing enzyme)
MRFRFLGTRGSIPTPGPETARYGGNTPCCEVLASSGHRIIVDAGTGILSLGKELRATPDALPLSLLLTHTHWDHIQGLPHFAPLWETSPAQAESPLTIYGPTHASHRLRSLLDGLFVPGFIHASPEARRAPLVVRELQEESFEIGSVTVRALFVPHPTVTLSYRFEEKGKSLVFATDLEYLGDEAAVQKERVVRFSEGAEVLVHDAMFTDAEYPKFRTWGHATTGDSLEVARRAGVRELYLYHHDPNRSDDALEVLLRDLRETRLANDPEIFLSQEGATLHL